MSQYPLPKQFDLPKIESQILEWWKRDAIFKRSMDAKQDAPAFVFYEGPPSANGMPGIHHVMSRTLKDLFCRYKSLKGFRVDRKGGWDTHGLPVELGVEKKLGITKEDIGKSISVAEYNAHCKAAVMEYKDHWDALTESMGYWVDLENPYITFERQYIESLWALLQKLYKKGFLYKGYSVQPYSPAAGTGLSSHELNLPGCYKEVKDTTIVAMFKREHTENEFLLAWTTTPWTLPSNTALAVGPKIMYALVSTYNSYTSEPILCWIAEPLIAKQFSEKFGYLAVESETEVKAFAGGNKNIPYLILERKLGKELEGVRYEQLMPYHQPETGKAFEVVCGDFVTTEDGTGIVHIAPSFGADDMMLAKENGLGALTLVDRAGRFVEGMGELSGRFVKDYANEANYESVDITIAIMLKTQNRAFKVEKYEHSYPHCWRTDKPVLYYPLDSWFIKTTAVKDRMVELNKTINWKPEFTGSGRFGNWLENLVDWNLSRSRYWGTPLPIWRTDDGEEELCIGSFEELKAEVSKSVKAGFMPAELSEDMDLHRPYVDDVILVSASGKRMKRELDLIDVWFDSGAMPYAQWGYPLKGEAEFKKAFPADYIAEGVDQTRGWFFTLHALAVMLEDSVAYKNVVANGLVLDKEGNKMSKRLGNAVNPFDLLPKVGADAVRFYMMANSQPWDNLKFDEKGIDEIKRKFFSTLYNTYSFYAMYANLDGYQGQYEQIPVTKRSELDRWILSALHTLIAEVDSNLTDYEPTKASRAIMYFVDVQLSNWYVRLSRRIFWKGELNDDKIGTYQTLESCLTTIAQLMAPITPFFADWLYSMMQRSETISVHEVNFPESKSVLQDKNLERRMQYAQTVCSLVLSLRKKENIKVRQPLIKVELPILDDRFKEDIELVKDLILSEVNVKSLEYLSNEQVEKTIKPNFKKLGPKFGNQMKQVAAVISAFTSEQIAIIERESKIEVDLEGVKREVSIEEVEILTKEVEGVLMASENGITVALDTNISEELYCEGYARELVNRIQNLRKDKDFNISDRIVVEISKTIEAEKSVNMFSTYICAEVLANSILFTELGVENSTQIEVNNDTLLIQIKAV